MRAHRRLLGAGLALALGVVPVAVVASPAAAAMTDLVINEVHSDSSPDWFELANPTGEAIPLDGLWYVDSDTADTTHWVALTGSVPAGGVLAVDSSVGLGRGDTVSIYQGDKAAFDGGTAVLVDTVTWPAGTHATSMGVCPPAEGLVAMTPTKGAANICPGIRINEVNSDPNPDWVELVNTATTAIDVSGWVLSDNTKLADPEHLQPLPAGTVIAAGGYLVVEYTAAGLGRGDEVNLYRADATTLVDTTTWPADTHATSWGRCADGTGAFRVTAPTRGAANDCTVTPPPALDPNWDDIEINEMSSLNADDDGNPGLGDAVELVNTGNTAVSIEGWYQTDGGAASGASMLSLADLLVWDGTALVPADSWVIPPGGYVVFSSKRGLSGEGDAVKIYGPGADAAARQLVDEQAYGNGDAGVSDDYESDSLAFAACPDGSDEFWRVTESSFGRDNTESCETASRRLDTPVVLNEVTNVDGRAELLNTGETGVDISGWELVDARGDVAHTVPAATTLASGAFYVADVEGLESADSLTIRDTEGASVIGHTWYEDGIASYSRCELFGDVSYVETPTATWGAANACPQIGTEVWPGPAEVSIVDAADAFTDTDANDEGDVSGAVFDPNDPGILWVAMNKGRLFKMQLVGGLYEPMAGWEGGIPVRFTDGGGELDAEGVVVGPDGAIYLTSERDNGRAKDTSHNVIARFDVSGVTAATTELVATHQWDVNGFVVTGTNLGLEGITYVSDAFLVESGWEVDGVGYRAADQPTPGLFVTAVEGTGALHFFSLPLGGAPVEVKVESSGFPFSMDVTYDRDRSALWTLCDDTCGGIYNLLTVVDGDFAVAHSYARPSGMDNLNNEGMAIAPASTCTDGLQSVVWTDDGDTGGYSLRAGALPCPEGDPAPWATIEVGSGTVARGGTLAVEVAGLKPGQVITATLFSDPIVASGLPAADASGTVRFSLAIPRDFAVGPHTLVVETAGEASLSAAVTVTAATGLAATGWDGLGSILPLAALLILAGGLLLVARRHGRPRTEA